MRSLIIGIILFLIWASLSTWYYSTRIFAAEEPEPVKVVQDEQPTQLPETVEAEKPVPPDLHMIYFGFDRDDFRPDQKLEEYLVSCKDYLLTDTSSCLMIAGHTDAIGSDNYNMDLGIRRASSVKNYLLSMGFSNSCIRTSSLGETAPIADNASEEGRAKNRRVELEINQ
jgi:outer membrane protein OmpA-like peptidoglycan-associated protein